MATNLPARRMLGGIATDRQDKAFAKELRAVQQGMTRELMEVQAIEAIEISKIETLEAVGHVGMASAFSLGTHRRALAEQDPTCIGCVDCVAEATVRAIGHRIETLGRRLG